MIKSENTCKSDMQLMKIIQSRIDEPTEGDLEIDDQGVDGAL